MNYDELHAAAAEALARGVSLADVLDAVQALTPPDTQRSGTIPAPASAPASSPLTGRHTWGEALTVGALRELLRPLPPTLPVHWEEGEEVCGLDVAFAIDPDCEHDVDCVVLEGRVNAPSGYGYDAEIEAWYEGMRLERMKREAEKLQEMAEGGSVERAHLSLPLKTFAVTQTKVRSMGISFQKGWADGVVVTAELTARRISSDAPVSEELDRHFPQGEPK